MLKGLVALSVLFTGLTVFAEDNIVGVGLVLSQDNHKNTRIEQVIANGPADRAGARAGEYILAVDGKSIAGTKLDNVVASIRGELGTRVVLTIGDLSGHSRDLAMIREVIAAPGCFMEGPVNLTTNLTDPTGNAPFALFGTIGNQYVNWYASGGWITAPYKGNLFQLSYIVFGGTINIRGTIHGIPINWIGTGRSIYGYQACIP